MSNEPPTIELRAVERAIDLRALGYTWDQVATRVEREIEVVRGWPHQYADFWTRRLAAAHRELDGETIGEARAILRHQLRSAEPKESPQIARVLFEHARRSQIPPAEEGPAAPEHLQIADFLEGLSHDELHAYVETQLARLTGVRTDDRDSPTER